MPQRQALSKFIHHESNVELGSRISTSTYNFYLPIMSRMVSEAPVEPLLAQRGCPLPQIALVSICVGLNLVSISLPSGQKWVSHSCLFSLRISSFLRECLPRIDFPGRIPLKSLSQSFQSHELRRFLNANKLDSPRPSNTMLPGSGTTPAKASS